MHNDSHPRLKDAAFSPDEGKHLVGFSKVSLQPRKSTPWKPACCLIQGLVWIFSDDLSTLHSIFLFQHKQTNTHRSTYSQGLVK